MRKIEAVIRPWTLDAVQAALVDGGVSALTVTEVAGFGHEPGLPASYRGVAYISPSRKRLRLEIVVPDAEARSIANAIVKAARTGRLGDGLVVILPVYEAVRVRTAERGLAAITGSVRPTNAGPPGPAARRRRRASRPPRR